MFANLPMNEIADGHLTWESPEVQAHIKSLIWGEWYEDEEGYLYIVMDEAGDQVHGPDNEMADAMTVALNGGALSYRLEEFIEGLFYIDYILRRFTPEDGFYHA